MNPWIIARLSLVLAGAATFLWGVRYEVPEARWAGMALMVASFILRFFNRRPPAA